MDSKGDFDCSRGFSEGSGDSKEKILRDGLEAIKARLDGVYDHLALVKFGPLSTLNADIYNIIEVTLERVTKLS